MRARMDERPAVAGGLEVVRLHESDFEECISIASRSFEQFDGRAEPVREWFNARISNNPWQRALEGIGVGVRHQGRLIAFRAMSAQPWWLEGRATVIAFAAHTAIDPEHRGAGLGSRLIAASCDLADVTGSTSAGDITQKIYRKQGFVAVGGEGNDFFRLRASYGGSMRSRLGGPLGSLAGRIADALTGAERALGCDPGFALELPASCGAEFDALWARARDAYPSCLERSSRYLQWRLFDFPTLPLQLLALRDARGTLRGYGIWHEQKYSRYVSCAVLRDLFVADDDAAARAALLGHALRHWLRLGISWVSLEVASARLTPWFRSLGYEPVPSIGNRYHVHARTPIADATYAGWFRSGLDGDYFDTRPSADT